MHSQEILHLGMYLLCPTWIITSYSHPTWFSYLWPMRNIRLMMKWWSVRYVRWLSTHIIKYIQYSQYGHSAIWLTHVYHTVFDRRQLLIEDRLIISMNYWSTSMYFSATPSKVISEFLLIAGEGMGGAGRTLRHSGASWWHGQCW